MKIFKREKYLSNIKSFLLLGCFMFQTTRTPHPEFTVVYTASLWPLTLTTTVRRPQHELGNKIFPQSPAIISCRSRFYYSLEEMADMDELFGSDGDSDNDNDQRGNDVC